MKIKKKILATNKKSSNLSLTPRNIHKILTAEQGQGLMYSMFGSILTAKTTIIFTKTQLLKQT